MNRLKPCPFCGGEGDLVFTIRDGMRGFGPIYYVVCDNCEAQTAEYGTEQRAVEFWNRRADQ